MTTPLNATVKMLVDNTLQKERANLKALEATRDGTIRELAATQERIDMTRSVIRNLENPHATDEKSVGE